MEDNMSTDVKDKNELSLIDGTKFEARPLKISLLKPFMKQFSGLQDVADDNEKSMDVLLDCVQIAFKQYLPALADNREAIEENLDLPTVYKIIDAASGMNLSDATGLLNSIK
jgi:hypothetical protein